MNLLGLDTNLVLNGLAAGTYESAPGVMKLMEPVINALHNWTDIAPETLAPWVAIILPLVCILILMGPIITIFPMFAIWLERKVSAHMQSRLGPMEIGWHGFLQTVADGVKLLAKEDIIPKVADKVLFILGPILAFTGIFLLVAVLPFGPFLSVTDMHLGIIFIAAVGSLEVIGVLMAGWASNNKWSLFGTMRLATQLVSYEIPLGLCLLTGVLVAGSFQLGAFNGQWEVARYVKLDGEGQETKEYISAEEVNGYRAEQEKLARETYRADLNRTVSNYVRDSLSTPKFILTSGDVESWKELFHKPVKGFKKKDGTFIPVADYMKAVNESGHQGEDLEFDLKNKYGELEEVPYGFFDSRVYYSLNGVEKATSEINNLVATKTKEFKEKESEEKRVEAVLSTSLKKKFGSIRSIGKQSGQSGFIWNWYMFRNPFMIFMLIIFFTAALAENKRAPFDLPEAESELVSGFHTEYSGMRFSIFFLAEYIAMFVVSLLTAVIFCGGWNTGIDIEGWLFVVEDPIIGNGSQMPARLLGLGDTETWRLIGYVLIGHGTLMLKTLFFVFVQMWLRWTLPRVRLDHVMDLCLKVLLPFSLAGLVLVACWELAVSNYPILDYGRLLFFGIGAALFLGWAGWFWTSFQAPLQTSIEEKHWDTAVKAEGSSLNWMKDQLSVPAFLKNEGNAKPGGQG